MQHRRAVTVLVVVIAALAAVAAGAGIFSRGGPGPHEYVSVRGAPVTVYGHGLYRHMSAEVALQGIAQDYVTLFAAVPALLAALAAARRNSLSGRILLGGALGYFFVTYLFYLMMAQYNALFLAYVALLGTTFFALAIVLLGFDLRELPRRFDGNAPVKSTGTFLILNALVIGLLWLSVVVPPLLTGSVIPRQVEHYTTLVVQGLDLALLLPLAVCSGWLLLLRRPLGYLFAPIYLVFLAVLMTALTAKVIAMGVVGYRVVPAIFVIPLLNVLSIVLTTRMISHLRSSGRAGP